MVMIFIHSNQILITLTANPLEMIIGYLCDLIASTQCALQKYNILPMSLDVNKVHSLQTAFVCSVSSKVD